MAPAAARAWLKRRCGGRGPRRRAVQTEDRLAPLLLGHSRGTSGKPTGGPGAIRHRLPLHATMEGVRNASITVVDVTPDGHARLVTQDRVPWR